MSNPSFGAWDRLSALNPWTSAESAGPPSYVHAQRCRGRIGRYEAVLEQIAADSATAEQREQAQRELAVEHQSRVSAVARFVSGGRPRRSRDDPRSSAAAALMLLVAIPLILVAARLALGALGMVYARVFAGDPPAIIGIFGGVLVLIAISSRPRRARRLWMRLRAGRCPDCAYDLRGCPPAFPSAGVGDHPIGPRACPECGSPWPLVPPPVGT